MCDRTLNCVNYWSKGLNQIIFTVLFVHNLKQKYGIYIFFIGYLVKRFLSFYLFLDDISFFLPIIVENLIISEKLEKKGNSNCT